MKKCLALIIALISILSFVAVPTFAEGEVNNNDIKFMDAFGFVDIVEGDEETVASYEITRLQLAEIFYNIVFPNKDSGAYGEKVFSDVPAEKQHIVSAVYALGVMRGYSDDIFAPDDKVTYVQAVKAIVSFLGYDLMAQNLGGYPSGYLSQATRLQILPGGNIPGDANATYAGIAAMLKKAVGVDVAVWNHAELDGTAILDVQEGVDYLEYYRGISVTRGIITGNYLTDVTGGNATNFFGVKLNGLNIEVSEGAHGLQEMLGYDVYVYYSNNNGILVAEYFEEGINNTVTIGADDIASVTKGSVKYYVDGSDSLFEVTFAGDAPLIYNGTFETTYTVQDINPFNGTTLDGNVTFVDNGNDGTFDTIVVKAYQTMVVSDVRNNKIYGKYNVSDNPMDKVIDVNYYKERNINIRNITGEMLSLGVLKAGHILNLCYDKNGVVKEIIASKDSMTGVIEEISYTGSKISAITVSGMTFKASSGIMVFDASNKLAPGITADIYFNCDAEVAVLDVENRYTDGFIIGYMIDAASIGALVQSVPCVVFTSEGEIKEYNIASRISFNGVPTENSAVLDALKSGEKRVKRQVVLYKTDLDGKVITAMQTATQIATDADAFDGFYQYPSESHYYSGGFKSFSMKYLANSNTIAFGIPNEDNRDDYEKYIITDLPSSEGASIGTAAYPGQMQLYGTKKEAMVVDIAVINATQGGGDTSRRPFFVVTKVAEALDDNGELGVRITGTYVQGTSLAEGGSFFIDKNLFINGHDVGVSNDANNGKRPFLNQNETMPEPGDIYRIPVFSDTGRIDIMDVKQFYQLYDYGDKTFAAADGKHQQDSASICHHMGKVVLKDNTSIKIQYPDGSYGAFELSSGYYKFAEITKDKRTGEFKAVGATHEAILSEDTHPGEGSTVFIHYRGAGIACFILND